MKILGINKPDVRFVIHHSLPKSIEGYHQVIPNMPLLSQSRLGFDCKTYIFFLTF